MKKYRIERINRRNQEIVKYYQNYRAQNPMYKENWVFQHLSEIFFLSEYYLRRIIKEERKRLETKDH